MVQMLQIQGLMGGRLKIVRFNARKNFDARVYKNNPLNSVIRSLKFTVLQVETDFAIEVWSELIPLIDAEISTFQRMLDRLRPLSIATWIQSRSG